MRSDKMAMQEPPKTKPEQEKFYKYKKLKFILLMLLSLMLLGGAAFAGYKYAKSGAPEASEESSGSIEEKSEMSKEVEPETVSSASGRYRVLLPEEWQEGTCTDNPDILFLAPTTELLGRCQSESFGMVSVSSASGDVGHTEEYYSADDYYASSAYSTAVIDGLSGYRVSYSIATESELGYPPVGTFEYKYNLYDPSADKTYIIAYRQLPSDPDHQSTFIEIAESFERT